MKKDKELLKRIVVNVLACVLALVFVFILSRAIYYKSAGFTQDKLEEDTVSIKEVVIDIPSGSGTKEIAKILYGNKLISSKLLFRINSYLSKSDGKYLQGSFALNTQMSDEEIIEILKTSSKDIAQVEIKVLEGYTLKDIANIFEEKGLGEAQEFLDAANTNEFDYSFLKNVKERENKLEGYLFPDTYLMREGSTASELISKMLSRFDEVKNDIEKEYGKIENIDEIVTIASIIEAEARLEDERALVSSVIQNRIDKDMNLQMCSTVMYALAKKKDVLLYSDLEIKSDYNTYLNKGLPIGPINNPSKASIIAALAPKDSEYLFFVLKNEETGEHFFTDKYEDFLNAKEEFSQKF